MGAMKVWRMGMRVSACCEAEGMMAAIGRALRADPGEFEEGEGISEARAREGERETRMRWAVECGTEEEAPARSFWAVAERAAPAAWGEDGKGARSGAWLAVWEERGEMWAWPDATGARNRAEWARLAAAARSAAEREELREALEGEAGEPAGPKEGGSKGRL